MGLLTIHCRSCGKLFLWFTGNIDQRCWPCQQEKGPMTEQAIKDAKAKFDGAKADLDKAVKDTKDEISKASQAVAEAVKASPLKAEPEKAEGEKAESQPEKSELEKSQAQNAVEAAKPVAVAKPAAPVVMLLAKPPVYVPPSQSGSSAKTAVLVGVIVGAIVAFLIAKHFHIL